MLKIKINKNILTITYKILNDLLFLILVFFVLMLIVEGLVPTTVSRHISFLQIIFFSTFNILAIYIVGSFSHINTLEQKLNKKITVFLAILSTLLIFNSLLKLNLIIASIILIITIISEYFIYKNIMD